jgi:hypothetical protein
MKWRTKFLSFIGLLCVTGVGLLNRNVSFCAEFEVV